MNPQLVYYICAAAAAVTAVMLGVGGAVWNLSSKITTVTVEIGAIKENHLAHVQKDIDEIKKDNKMIIQHLLNKKG